MRKDHRRDHLAMSAALLLVMTGVAIVGAIVIGLVVLSYNDNGMSDDFSYYVVMGPAVEDGTGIYYISIDSMVGTPYSTFDIVVNNKTSRSTLDGMIGNESAWRVEGMSIYVDDANSNGRCDRGDRIVILSGNPVKDKAVDLTVRNAKFGLELSSVSFVLKAGSGQ